MDERRYTRSFLRVPDDDENESRHSVTFDAVASHDSLSVCAASVGAFEARRDDLEKLLNGPDPATRHYDERERRERLELLNKRHLTATSGRSTRDDRNGALSPEEEERAEALEKLLRLDVGVKEKGEVEKYLARLRQPNRGSEVRGRGNATVRDKLVRFRSPERERGEADGQGDVDKLSVSHLLQQFQTVTKRVLGEHAEGENKDEVSVLRAEVEKLTQRHGLMRRREEAANSRVEQLEAEKAELVVSRGELQRKFDVLKNQKSQAEGKTTAQSSVDSLEQLLCMRDDSSQSQLSTIAEDLEGEKQIAALQEEKEDMDKRVSMLQRDVQREQSFRQTAEKEGEELRLNIEQLKSELSKAHAENAHLMTKLHALTSSSATSRPRSKSPMNKSMSGSDPQITSAAQMQWSSMNSHGSLSSSGGQVAASASSSQAISGAVSLPDIARQWGSSDTGFKSLPGDRWGSGVSLSTASLPQSPSITSFQVLSPYGSESNLEQEQEMLMVSPEAQQTLADALRGCSNMQQLIQAVLTYSSGVQSDRFRHALIEKERLQARLSKLESESDLLRLSLGECKDYAEHYSLISRQFESNNTILTACLYFTSRVVQIYEKVLGLLEADLGVMNVACRMAGVRNPHELVGNTAKQAWGSTGSGASQENLAAARHAAARLRSAESEAKDLLQTFSMYATSAGPGTYIDGDITGHTNKSHESLPASGSVNRQLTSSQSSGYASTEREPLRFYEERSPIFSRTSSNSTTSSGGGTTTAATTASAMVDVEAMREVVSRLKDQAMGLKLQRTKREKSVVEINTSAFPDAPRDLTYYNSQSQIERDFEHALLLLELATVKDDKVDLKAKNYLVERELRSYELRLQTGTAQEKSYMVHIDHLKAELKEQTRKRRKLQRELKELKEKHQAAQLKDDQTPSSDSSSIPHLGINRTQSLPTVTSDQSPLAEQLSRLQQEINEAERRERSLRLRNQELGETFEIYIKSHQDQTNQQQSYVNDLKKAYDSLVSAYNKLKKRFQVQQSSHEQEIAALRTELAVIQRTEDMPSQEERMKYLELAQEETNL